MNPRIFLKAAILVTMAFVFVFPSVTPGEDKSPVLIGLDAEFGHKTSTSAQAVEQGIPPLIADRHRNTR